MNFPGIYFLLVSTTGFLPFAVTTNLTAATELMGTGLLYYSPFECVEDRQCDYCKHVTDAGFSLCTPFGQFEDFCLFCRTNTPLRTCPGGFCVCGLSMFNTEKCKPSEWGPGYCDGEYCADLSQCGKCRSSNLQSEKMDQTEIKLEQNEELKEVQQILKALEQ